MTERESRAAQPERRVHIMTWGCQMNVYDSSRMADILATEGYRLTETPADADLVILNTCHIREKAAEKVFSELGRLNRLKQTREAAGGRMRLAVAGCVAQAAGAEILARAPYVSLVFGPQTYHHLPELLARADREGSVVDTEFPAEPKFDFLPETRARPTGPATFLTIQEGCDKFCSFCVVPYTRGAESSRPAAAVLKEARLLVARGARELTLLGQNVNAWHGAGPDGSLWSLARLLQALAAIPGLLRLRYTTSHPRDMSPDLIAAHRTIPTLMPFLHLPVQSGSDAVLARMHRRYTAKDYLRVIEEVRTARPDIALSSDFIVGYPGETDKDFAATLDLVRAVGFAQAFSFKYSPRPGTPAAADSEQVGEHEKETRLAALQSLLNEQQQRYNRAMIGASLAVLFTGVGRHKGQILGRSAYLQAVHVDAPISLIGSVQRVRIDAAHPNSLAGTLESKEQAAA